MPTALTAVTENTVPASDRNQSTLTRNLPICISEMKHLRLCKEESMRQRSVAAFCWSAADIGSRQILQFVVSVMLARLLNPSEFGLLGMISIFVGLAQSFADSGFGVALIQRAEITEEDKSTVFFFNLGAAVLMATCLYTAAPAIASFYRQPVLIALTRFMSLNIVVTASTTVHTSILARELNFQTPWKIGVASNMVSGAVAVILAFKGGGVWSLAWQSLVASLITALLLWLTSSWKPRCAFQAGSLQRLFGYGSKVLGGNLINSVFDRIQLLLIGRIFSPTQLGYFTRAYSTQWVPGSILSSVVAKVTFPLFAGVAADPARLKRGSKQAIRSLTAITMPMMIGLALVSKPLVEALFGKNWLPCVPYLQILAIAGMFLPLNMVNLTLITAVGRSDLYLRAELIKKLIFGAILLLSLPISVMAVVYGILAANGACYLVNVRFTCKVIPYGFREQTRECLTSLISASGMAGAILLVNYFCAGSPLISLAASVLFGAFVYCVICWLIGDSALEEGLRFVLNRQVRHQQSPA